LNSSFLGDFVFSLKKFSAFILLTSGTLAWFFLIQYTITDMFASFSSNPFLEYVNAPIFYAFAVISAIAGIFISRKVDNRKFLLSWIALGVLSTVLLTLARQTVFMPFLSILLGLSLGLGLPSSMAFIADRTFVEERARVSGITIFAAFGLAILVMAAVEIFGFGLPTLILLFALVRSTSFLALFLDKFDRKNRIEEDSLPRPDYKDFFSYIIPWMMFVLVGMLAWSLIPQAQYQSAVSIGRILRFTCIAVFGIISGIIADRLGRKPAIIIGLLVLGVSFFVLGIGMSEPTVIIYLTASGVAWGSFFAMYLVVPGDLSISGSREKFYALITVLPLVLLGSIPYLPGLADYTRYSSVFSQVLSLILFLSIIPVLRAKETLPDIKMRERRLKDHIEKVGKLVSKSKKKE
jgi:MFS family permease